MPPDQLNELEDIFAKFPDDVLLEFFQERNTRDAAVSFLKASHITNTLGSTGGCTNTLMWIMGGRARTDRDGQAVIKLNEYLCPTRDEESPASIYDRPSITSRPWFVATPRISSPILLTTAYVLKPINPPGASQVDVAAYQGVFEVELKVMSWKLDGKPASYIGFDWNCIVEGARWTIIN
jgi:hypothetical protein